MRIGVLTFHNGPNFGGLLQAWHMVHAIRRLGYECHAVNYLHPTHHQAAQARIPVRNLRSLRARAYWELKKFGFRGFAESICRHPFTSDVNAVPWDDFDAFCVGSDVVWEYQNPGYGKDPIYFGEVPGLAGKPIFSYAASCGPANPDGPFPDYVETGIRRFSALGLRDEATASLACNACNKESTIVVDPTWLNDDPEESWSGPPEEPYLFLYGGRKVDSATTQTILDYCRSRNLKLVSALTPCGFADKMYRCLTPFQWVGLFRHAECVIPMGTLHGTVYSIKYQKPFVLITNSRTTQKISTILERCGQSHRMVEASNFSKDTLRLLDPHTAPPPSVPEAWRSESLDFLQRTLLACTGPRLTTLTT